MTPDQATTVINAAGELMNSFAWERLIPLVMLLAMFGGFVWILVLAQRRDDFDASEFLRDDKGKLSFWRLSAFVCLGLHAWNYMIRTQNGAITFNEQVLWGCLWSGSAVVMMAVEKWVGKSSTIEPTVVQQTTPTASQTTEEK